MILDRVLFVVEKYCDAKEECGPTNAESVLIGAILANDLVKEHKVFYYDVAYKDFGQEKMRQRLIETCQQFKPQVVVYTPFLGRDLGLVYNPIDGFVPRSGDVVTEIGKTGAIIYSHLWDTSGTDFDVRYRWQYFSDVCGIVESDARRFNNERIIQVYSVVDPRAVYNKHYPTRDIDLCFLGSWTAAVHGPRYEGINYLKQENVPIYIDGGQRNHRLSWEEYCDILNRCKIQLNWGINPILHSSQIKGRVFETMACGGLLLEDAGTETPRFFTPGTDYVMFTSKEDMLNKIRYYLSHDEDRLKIAESGYQKIQTTYNARNMWTDIFTKCLKLGRR